MNSSSSPVIFPASRRRTILSAFFIIESVFSTTSSSISASFVPISRSILYPPVSTRWTGFPAMNAVASTGSRVTPGVGSTIASLLRMNLLNSVDFPTFGLPAMTTSGRFVYSFPLVNVIPSSPSSVAFASICPNSSDAGALFSSSGASAFFPFSPAAFISLISSSVSGICDMSAFSGFGFEKSGFLFFCFAIVFSLTDFCFWI